jgi:Tfp pilus assembly protein PilO
MKLSYRNKLILAGAVVVLLAVLVVVLLVLPQFRQLRTYDDQLAEADRQIQQAQTLLAQRQEVKSRSAETEAKRIRLANQMPETPELPSLIIELQDTVNDSGLEFASLTPNEPVVAEPGYSEVELTLLVRGTWQDTVDFMQRLPRLVRQVRVVGYRTALQPSRDQEETDTTIVVETSMTIRVYMMPSEITPPAAPPAPETGDDGTEAQ